VNDEIETVAWDELHDPHRGIAGKRSYDQFIVCPTTLYLHNVDLAKQQGRDPLGRRVTSRTQRNLKRRVFPRAIFPAHHTKAYIDASVMNLYFLE
jgi:hypothetical protein